MSVKIDPSGSRSIQVEVEVPGTPEQVWQAIATGPGISSWFVPTDLEEREGGETVSHFGPGMDSTARITAWEPPHRFAAEGGDMGPGSPPVGTEWIVEARSGGTCVVRVVHSLFTSSDQWDDQLEGFESGWPGFFRILKLYLEHFRGLACTSFRILGSVPENESVTWGAMTGALGLKDATVGEHRTASAGAPPLAGVVEWVWDLQKIHEIVLRLDEPAPGICTVGAYDWGGKVHVGVNFYLYGDRAPAAAVRDEPLWQEWVKELFPAVASGVSC